MYDQEVIRPIHTALSHDELDILLDALVTLIDAIDQHPFYSPSEKQHAVIITSHLLGRLYTFYKWEAGRARQAILRYQLISPDLAVSHLQRN